MRKIGGSPVPIISAVGHETDVTLADFAADVRAATPSMAAELAVPVQSQLQQDLLLRQRTLLQRYETYLQYKRMQLEHMMQHRVMQKPEVLLQEQRQCLDDIAEGLQKGMQTILQQKQQQIAAAAQHLNALSPLQVLSRGYALCQNEQQQIIRSAEQVEIGQTVNIVLEQGQLSAIVSGKEETV